MAIIKNGKLHGRVGDQVYFVRNGKQYVRAIPKARRKKDPQSELLPQQTAFSLAGKYLKPLLPIVRYSFSAEKGLTGMNYAMQYAVKNAVMKSAAGFLIDPSNVLISYGNVQQILSPMVSILANIVTLTWKSNETWGQGRNNKVYLLAYSEVQQMIQLSSGEAMRGDKELQLELDEDFTTAPFHLYAFVTDRLHGNYSESQYLGKFQSSNNP